MKQLLKIKGLFIALLFIALFAVLHSGSAQAAAAPGCYTTQTGVSYLVKVACNSIVEGRADFNPNACWVLTPYGVSTLSCNDPLLAGPDFGDNNPAKEENCKTTSTWILGFPTWYKYLTPEWDAGSKSCIIHFQIAQPFTRVDGTKGFESPSTGDIGKVFLAIVEIALRIAGMAAVGFIIYGGFNFLISQGDPQKAASARRSIVNALIGLVISAIAVFIVQLLAKNLLKP